MGWLDSLLGDGQKFIERKDSDAGETFFSLLMQVLALAAVSAGVEFNLFVKIIWIIPSSLKWTALA